MQNRINYITTTSIVEGHTVEKYLGIVTSQVVHGTDFFSDIMAGFRDFVGGYSATYQNKLKEMEDRVLRDLRKKAIRLGANAIIGLRLDYDEISGKGKGMLMLTAQGTAVKLEMINEREVESNKDPEIITYKQLETEINKRRILREIYEGSYAVKDLEGIALLVSEGIGDFKAVAKYIIAEPVNLKENRELFIEFMANVAPREISEYLQSSQFRELTLQQTKRLIALIGYTDWFDYDVIKDLLRRDESQAHLKALMLLGFQKVEYTKRDIPEIKKMTKCIEETFSQYPIRVEKQAMFGKHKEVWICPACGKETAMEIRNCIDMNCGANWYGMTDNTKTPQAIIDNWNMKAELIEQLLGDK